MPTKQTRSNFHTEELYPHLQTEVLGVASFLVLAGGGGGGGRESDVPMLQENSYFSVFCWLRNAKELGKQNFGVVIFIEIDTIICKSILRIFTKYDRLYINFVPTKLDPRNAWGGGGTL